MEKLNLGKNNLRKFAITMSIAFLAITVFILLKDRHIFSSTLAISAVFFGLAFSRPGLLKPVYICWMSLAFVLGWINTRLILCVMFYLVFTPIGLIMRVFRIDLLDRKIEKNKESYWKDKEKKEFSPLDYQRQF